MPNWEEFNLATETPPVSEIDTKKRQMSYEEFSGADVSTPGDLSNIPVTEPLDNARFTPEDLSPAMQSFVSGLANFAAGAARIPAAATSIAFTKRNLTARLMGWTHLEKKPPAFLVDNPITQYFEEASESFSFKRRTYPNETLATLMDKREFRNAGEYLFHSVIENSVYSLTAVGGALAGVPQAYTLGLLGSVSGAQTYAQARKKNIAEIDRGMAALANGTLEAVWESFGTFKIISYGERLFRDVGKQTGKVIIKNSAILIAKAFGQEGSEEFGTQLSQDLVNKILKVEDIPFDQFLPRAFEAAAVGALSGATQIAPGAALSGIRAAADKNVDDAKAQDIINRARVMQGKEPEVTAPTPPVAPVPEAPVVVTPEPDIEPGVTPEEGPVRRVTVEFLPSKSFGLPISDATTEQKQIFSQDVLNSIRDAETGEDLLARELGIESTTIDPSTGSFEGEINPNAITIIKSDIPVEKVRQYARAFQYIFKQDAVPYFRLIDEGENNAFRISFSEDLTPKREQEFDAALSAALTKMTGWTKLNSRQIVVANFGDFTSEEFESGLDRFGEENGERLGIEQAEKITSEGEYLTHDWVADPKGDVLRSKANPEGRSDIQDRLDRRRKDFESKIIQFAERPEVRGLDLTPATPVSEIRSELSRTQKLLSDFREEQARLGVRGEPSARAETLEQRIAELQDALAIREGVKKIDRPTEKPTIGPKQALREVLRAQAQAATLAARMTKKEIEASQTALIKALEESKLAPEDRAKFIRTIKNIQTQQQLVEALPDIQDRVERLIEASARRKTIKAIGAELRKIEPKKKQKGKFIPIIQDALSRMRSAFRMNKEQATLALAARQAADATGTIQIPSPIDAFENMMLNFVSTIDEMSVSELENILETIRALKLTGKIGKRVKQLQEQLELDDQKAAVNSIAESRPVGHVPVSNEDQHFSRLFAWWTRATNWQMGWNNLMNRISWADKSTKTNQSVINKITSVAEAKIAEKRGNRKAIEFLNRIYHDAFGQMNALQTERAMLKDSEQKELGTFTDAIGQRQRIIMSVDEARSLWMQFRDPSLAETFFGTQEKGMHYTQEMRNVIEGLLTPADIQFTRALFENYQPYYFGFNAVFSDIMGFNLPRNLFYSPIQRAYESKANDQADANQILGEIAHRKSILPSAGQKRVQNLRRIKQIGAIDNYVRHTTQVEHYKAWARKIRQLKGIFGDESIRDAIKVNFGKDMMSKIDSFIEDFTRGGIDRSHEMANFNAVKNNIVISTLALKGALLPKQLVSFLAAAEFVPLQHFVPGVLDLAVDTKRKLKILGSSELLRSRGLAITPELGEAMRSKEYLVFQLSPTVKNMLLVLVKLGDRGGIVLGGWSVYRYHRVVLKESGKKSIKAFEDFLDSSQQSADLDQQSWLQRGNSLQRLTGVFMSSQNQYLRKEIAATDDYFAGRITAEEYAKQMFIYHVLLPTMFQFVASGFRFDWREMARAALVGSLNGFFILHDLFIGIASTVLGLKTFPSGSVIDSGFRNVRRAMRELREGDVDMETFIKVLTETSKAAGLVTGLPVPAAIGILEGTKMLMDAKTKEDYLKGIKRISGWSNFVLDQGENPNKRRGPF